MVTGNFKSRLGLGIFVLWAVLATVSTTAQAKRLERLRVYLDWFPNVEFAGMYAAQKRGWYKEAGIDLRMVFHGLEIIPNVLRGDADIGMHSAHDLVRWAGRKPRVKAFAAQYQLNPNCIVVGKNSNIKSIKDLKGKTLGVLAPQEYDMFRVMLGHAGLSFSDVTFKPVSTFNESELVDLLRSGAVDGIIAWEFNWTITFALLGYEVRVFPGNQNGFHYYGTSFFAEESYIRKHRALLAKFLKVTFDGWREVYRDPVFYTKLVIDKYYPKDHWINGSRELTFKQQLLEVRLRQRYLLEGVGLTRIGYMSHLKWRQSLEVSKRYGLIPMDLDVKSSDVFDDSVLKLMWGRPS